MEILEFVGKNNNIFGKQSHILPCVTFFPSLCCKEIQFDYMLLYLSALHNTWKRILDFVKY